MMVLYYEILISVALIKIIIRLPFLQEIYTNTTYRNNCSWYFPCLCNTCPLSRWSHFICSHSTQPALEKDGIIFWRPQALQCFAWPCCADPVWLLTGLDVVLPLSADKRSPWPARAATGALWREQPLPPSPLAGASCFCSEGWWIHRF